MELIYVTVDELRDFNTKFNLNSISDNLTDTDLYNLLTISKRVIDDYTNLKFGAQDFKEYIDMFNTRIIVTKYPVLSVKTLEISISRDDSYTNILDNILYQNIGQYSIYMTDLYSGVVRIVYSNYYNEIPYDIKLANNYIALNLLNNVNVSNITSEGSVKKYQVGMHSKEFFDNSSESISTYIPRESKSLLDKFKRQSDSIGFVV